MRIFENKQIDFLNQPMFFGENVNVSRFDIQKYPFIEQQHRKQIGFFWVPEEISLENDKYEFHQLSPAAQHIFTSNLKYQIVLDSVQGRGPGLALLPYVSIPELESFIETWSFFEGPIHSRSYTHIIRNLYDDPSSVLDHITDIQELVDRAKAVTMYYDDFINYATHYRLLGYGTHTVNGNTIEITQYDLHKKLYLMMVSIYILEAIRFYASFACSWAFAESMGVLKKNAKIIKMICRDENLHMAVTSFMLKKMADGSEGKLLEQIAKDSRQEVNQMFLDAVQQEFDWADYLFKDGSIIGLNAEILKDYIKFIANKRVKSLGLSKLIDGPSSNPLPWTESWISGKSVQVAPQETEITAYIVGGINKNVNKEVFKDFEL